MTARRGATPRPALVQAAYHAADVRLQEIGKAVQRSAEALRLDAQEEYGVISADEYADRMLALEERAGWNEAHAERDTCRAALLAWGLRQTRTQWAIYGHLFQGATLAELEALWARPTARLRLTRIVMKLRVG